MHTLGSMEKIEDIVPFGLRMRSSLREKLEADVRLKKKTVDRRWSLNSEIVDRLEKSYQPQPEIKDYPLDQIIDELKRRLGEDSVAVRVEVKKPPEEIP